MTVIQGQLHLLVAALVDRVCLISKITSKPSPLPYNIHTSKYNMVSLNNIVYIDGQEAHDEDEFAISLAELEQNLVPEGKNLLDAVLVVQILKYNRCKHTGVTLYTKRKEKPRENYSYDRGIMIRCLSSKIGTNIGYILMSRVRNPNVFDAHLEVRL